MVRAPCEHPFTLQTVGGQTLAVFTETFSGKEFASCVTGGFVTARWGRDLRPEQFYLQKKKGYGVQRILFSYSINILLLFIIIISLFIIL